MKQLLTEAEIARMQFLAGIIPEIKIAPPGNKIKIVHNGGNDYILYFDSNNFLKPIGKIIGENDFIQLDLKNDYFYFDPDSLPNDNKDKTIHLIIDYLKKIHIESSKTIYFLRKTIKISSKYFEIIKD